MRKVLICVHPKWCELIFNGQKTIEVRKSFPRQLETPFEVLVYCTKGKENEKMCFDRYSPYIGNGKVIGSFICDEVDEYTFSNYDAQYRINDVDLVKTCLNHPELIAYGKGKTLRGLHITAPKLFDKPRALGEFYDGRGRPIKRAFQSWGYCNGEEN